MNFPLPSHPHSRAALPLATGWGLLLTLLLTLLLLPAARPLLAAPAGFSESVYASGLDRPVSMAWAPDSSGRLFVTEKAHGVRIIKNGQLLPAPFALFSQLYSGSECGVLGICFDPDYLQNRYVYVFVTVSAGEQQIVRFTDVANRGAARTVIVRRLPTLGQNHNGGALAFGPDGKLYWAVGDNGEKVGVDGNLTSLAAKVGRGNADGSVPADNPFRDGAGPINDFIWATGFRNPFSMAFQPRTGRLFLNVVGSTPSGQTEPNSGPGYEQVFALQGGEDGGYDDYEGNQPSGSRYSFPIIRPFAHPVLQYKTSSTPEPDQTRTLGSVSVSNGLATLTTSSAHPYRAGQAIVLSNASNASLNGTYCVQNVPSSTTLTASAPAGASGNASGGSLAPLVVGSSITGGAFYESSAFPEAYRGNFFFCDYVSDRLMRAVFNASNQLESLQAFSTNLTGPVDCAVGPDGALYVASLGSGTIRRIAWTASPSDLIVSPSIFTLNEGGRTRFTVRLGAAPAGTVSVRVHRSAGDSDVQVLNGTDLTFTPSNWDQPQGVTLGAEPDADSATDQATFTVSSPGLGSEVVRVNVNDTTGNTPLLSASNLLLGEGKSGGINVSLPTPPKTSITVTVRRTSGPQSVRVTQGAALVFTPDNFATPQPVRFHADQDANAFNNRAVFTVAARGYTTARVTVSVRDDDPSAPVFRSAPPTGTVVDLAYAYTPLVHAQPDPLFSLLEAPAGMTIDPATGALAWVPAQTGSFQVSIRAGNGLAPAGRQSFTLNVAADQPPKAFLGAPVNGAILSGQNAEFFGSAADDYGCYKAEFYVDDALVYTDATRENHFHCGGAHNLFDTTALSNGVHVLKMVVYDDKDQSASASATVTVAN